MAAAAAASIDTSCRMRQDVPPTVFQTLIDATGVQDSSSPLGLSIDLSPHVAARLAAAASTSSAALAACVHGALRRLDGAPLLVWKPDGGDDVEPTQGVLAATILGNIFAYELSGSVLTIRVHRKYLPVSKCHGDAPFVFAFLIKCPGMTPAVVVTSPFISASKEPRAVGPKPEPKRKRAPPSNKPVLGAPTPDDVLISAAFAGQQGGAAFAPVASAAGGSAAGAGAGAGAGAAALAKAAPASARRSPAQQAAPAPALSGGKGKASAGAGGKRKAEDMEQVAASPAAAPAPQPAPQPAPVEPAAASRKQAKVETKAASATGHAAASSVPWGPATDLTPFLGGWAGPVAAAAAAGHGLDLSLGYRAGGHGGTVDMSRFLLDDATSAGHGHGAGAARPVSPASAASSSPSTYAGSAVGAGAGGGAAAGGAGGYGHGHAGDGASSAYGSCSGGLSPASGLSTGDPDLDQLLAEVDGEEYGEEYGEEEDRDGDVVGMGMAVGLSTQVHLSFGFSFAQMEDVPVPMPMPKQALAKPKPGKPASREVEGAAAAAGGRSRAPSFSFAAAGAGAGAGIGLPRGYPQGSPPWTGLSLTASAGAGAGLLAGLDLMEVHNLPGSLLALAPGV